MKDRFAVTGTVTYAIKGRNALRDKGYYAEIRRLTDTGGNYGCGYGVYTNADAEAVRKIFSSMGIKLLGFKN